MNKLLSCIFGFYERFFKVEITPNESLNQNHLESIFEKSDLVEIKKEEPLTELEKILVESFSKEPEITEYPILLKSKNDEESFEIFPLYGYNKRGIMEETFFSELWEKFPENIFTSVTIKFADGISFVPDIFYYDKEGRIFIDIEIDEPYTHDNNKALPIHFTNSDTARNNKFVENGICIIRFTEEQVVRNISRCIDIVEHFVNGEQIIDSSFKQRQWNYDEALLMAQQDYRNTYLKGLNKEYFPTLQCNSRFTFCGKIFISYCYPQGHRRLRIEAYNSAVINKTYSYNDWLDFYCEENLLLKKIISIIYPNEKLHWLKHIERYPYSELVAKTVNWLREYLDDSLIIIELNELKHGISLYEETKFKLVLLEKEQIKMCLNQEFNFLIG